jgi:hypothetical protein
MSTTEALLGNFETTVMWVGHPFVGTMFHYVTERFPGLTDGSAHPLLPTEPTPQLKLMLPIVCFLQSEFRDIERLSAIERTDEELEHLAHQFLNWLGRHDMSWRLIELNLTRQQLRRILLGWAWGLSLVISRYWSHCPTERNRITTTLLSKTKERARHVNRFVFRAFTKEQLFVSAAQIEEWSIALCCHGNVQIDHRPASALRRRIWKRSKSAVS